MCSQGLCCRERGGKNERESDNEVKLFKCPLPHQQWYKGVQMIVCQPIIFLSRITINSFHLNKCHGADA